VEQAAAPGEVGAGIQLPPNACRVLAELGVLEAVRKAAVRPERRLVRNGRNGAEIHRKELGSAVEAATGAPYLVLHRADFLDALLSAARSPSDEGDAVSLEFGHRVTGFVEVDDEVILESESGATWSGDILVGADGIHSTLRKELGERDHATYSGESIWRAVVPVSALDEDLHVIAGSDLPVTTIWAGPRRHVVTYPLRGGDLINVAATIPSHEIVESYTTEGRVEDMVASYEGWDARLLRILSSATSTRLWPLFVRQPLENWSRGRVALIGDAAHPMLPYQAQGSAQALEDALVLVAVVSDSLEDPAAALQMYESLRKPRATAIQRAAVRSGEAWGLSDGAQQARRDADLQQTEGNSGAVSYDWLWEGTPTEAPVEGP
jgi:salicylate hydroxylase